MGAADDFLNSFFAAYPHARGGKLSMEELNKLMAEYQHKMNSAPLDDFDGLSPAQMNTLLYAPLAPGCMLQFRKGMEDHLDKVPLFKLLEILLNEIQKAGKLKLTITGNLPVRVCELLCNQNLIYWKYMKYVKRIREEEIPYLWPLKQFLMDEGIVKKRNNALSFTKNGEILMSGPKAVRFIQLFSYFAGRFHWGNFYRREDNGQCGQLGWAYSLALLSKYGSKPNESEFYSLKLMQAFEKNLWNSHNARKEREATEDYHRAYAYRFFECFTDRFGLVDIVRKRDEKTFFDRLTVTKSILFDQLFEVKNWN